MNISKKLSLSPCTLVIIAVWIVIWLTVTMKDVSPVLCGKGIAKIGTEYYRFFTAGLTHTNVWHLLANVSALFWVGYLYEHRIGNVKFMLIGVLCAVTAQFIFLCIDQNIDYSIGGSPYIFSFFGFGLVMQYLSPDFPKITLGTWSGNWLAVYGIASNIPSLLAKDTSTVFIHAIALAVGALTGLVCHLLKLT